MRIELKDENQEEPQKIDENEHPLQTRAPI